MAERSTIGTDTNDEVTLLVYPATVFGIGHPESIGDCTVLINCYD